MGGGDHAHVGLHRLVPADTVEVAIRQHPQQPGLQVERHVADFIEEQGAAFGLLEAAAPRGLGAGEGAALMAEQLRLEQILRDRRRIEGDERLLRARAVLVQRTRDEFLAGARFARDQHRHVRLRQAADGAEHFLHGRRLAEDFGRFGGSGFDARFAQAFLQRAANQFDRLVDIERLGEVFEGTALEGGDRRIEVGKGGDDDDRQARVARLDGRQQVEAGLARHADVGHQHLRCFGFERGHRIACVGKAAGGEVLARQCFFQHPADRGVVVDYPDRFHVFALPRNMVLQLCGICLSGGAGAYGKGSKILKSVNPGRLSHSITPKCCCTKVCANVSPSPLPPSVPDTSG